MRFGLNILLYCLIFGQSLLLNTAFAQEATLAIRQHPQFYQLIQKNERPSMDQVVSIAIQDRDKWDIWNSESLQRIISEEVKYNITETGITEQFAELEVMFPQFQFFTLGRDAVGYSDMFDAIQIAHNTDRRAKRVNLSGELARTAEPKLLFEYLVSVGFPPNKDELLSGPPIVFMDYTGYNSTSQLRRLMQILVKSYKLSKDELILAKSKLVPLVTSSNFATTSNPSEFIINRAENDIVPLNITSTKFPRAIPMNGKFDQLVRSDDNKLHALAGNLEKPSETQILNGIIQMLAYFVYSKSDPAMELYQNHATLYRKKLDEVLQLQELIEKLNHTESKRSRSIVGFLNKAIQTNNPDYLRAVVLAFFSHEKSVNYDIELLKILKLNNLKIHLIVLNKLFRMPYAGHWKQSIEYFLNSNDDGIVRHVIYSVFSSPSAYVAKDVLMKFINKNVQKNNHIALQYLAASETLQDPRLKNDKDILLSLINFGNVEIIWKLAASKIDQNTPNIEEILEAIFRRYDKNNKNWKSIFWCLVENVLKHKTNDSRMVHWIDYIITNSNESKSSIAKILFSESGQAHIQHLLLKIIDTATEDKLMDLAFYVFTKPSQFEYLLSLRALVEKGNKHVRTVITDYAHNYQHLHTPEYTAIIDAAKLEDPDLRKKFLAETLDKGILPQRCETQLRF